MLGKKSEVGQDLVTELMSIRSNKRPFFQKGIRARTLILSTLWRGCHPSAYLVEFFTCFPNINNWQIPLN